MFCSFFFIVIDHPFGVRGAIGIDRQELTALRMRYDGNHKRLALAEQELKQERGERVPV